MVGVSANVFKNKHEQGFGLCIPSGEALMPEVRNPASWNIGNY